MVRCGWLVVLGVASGVARAQVPCDPVLEQTVVPRNPQVGARFGQTVELEGDLALVGAPQWGGSNTGGIFVYQRTGGVWGFDAFLMRPGTARFGDSILLHDETIFASCKCAGNYLVLYARIGVAWNEVGQITSSDGVPLVPLDLEGDTLVAGSPSSTSGAGAVYVFRGSGTTWTEEAVLVASDPAPDRAFGAAGALDGDRLVIGSPNDMYGSPTELPAVYVFERSGTAWTEVAALRAADTALLDLFGNAVALEGSRLLVGAPRDDDGPADLGAVYELGYDGTSWNEVAKVVPSVGATEQLFGHALRLEGDRLVVGAPGMAGGDTRGAVHAFDGSTGTWTETFRVEAPEPQPFSNPDDRFGTSLALEGATLLVGEPKDRNMVAGFSGSFSAYVLEGPQSYCTGKLNSLGCVPFVTTEGVPSATATAPFRILARDVIDGSFGFLLYGTQKANLGFHGGKLCIKAPVERLLPPKFAKADGVLPCRGVHRRDFNAHVQGGSDPALSVGAEVFAQWFQRDPADPAGFGDSLTDAVRFRICP